MVSCNDVATYILQKLGPMTAMKLQKLVYYSQAWSLVWDEKPLFQESIEAWANGPVAPALYRLHKGEYMLNDWPYGDSSKLNDEQRETIDAVLNFYGKKDSQWLSDLTHQEDPWITAREGLRPGERGNTEISWAAMAEYYSSL